ncbi:glycosyltransferase [Trueperella pyogenes]|uniref:glycosyltransferase n=1 Tax=Trueperella pyogenes TaxID=1661 RepID=UPI00345D28DB
MPAMIFHAAYRLNPASVSASAIRPIQMKAAFAEAGFDVFDLTGTAAERAAKFAKLKDAVSAGQTFDFMYSESSTIPPMIGDPNHFPHPLIDARIFAWLVQKTIPCSVFYRDIYWRFADYVARVGKPLASAMRQMYKAELFLYRRYMTKIYVPSLEMAAKVPQLDGAPVVALPPGGINTDAVAPPSPLHLLYVGGIGAHYQLDELVAALKISPQAQLTICTSRDRWEAAAGQYGIDDCPNIQVVHRSGRELIELYRQANVAAIMVDPSHYWQFAVPVKLFEYVNYGKPILVSRSTLAAEIVEKNDWGWAIDNDRGVIARALAELPASDIEQTTARVEAARSAHTWVARAKQVARDLS